jgi:hypothetical protein
MQYDDYFKNIGKIDLIRLPPGLLNMPLRNSKKFKKADPAFAYALFNRHR